MTFTFALECNTCINVPTHLERTYQRTCTHRKDTYVHTRPHSVGAYIHTYIHPTSVCIYIHNPTAWERTYIHDTHIIEACIHVHIIEPRQWSVYPCTLVPQQRRCVYTYVHRHGRVYIHTTLTHAYIHTYVYPQDGTNIRTYIHTSWLERAVALSWQE